MSLPSKKPGYLRRNWLVILIIVIIGLLIYYFNRPIEKSGSSSGDGSSPDTVAIAPPPCLDEIGGLDSTQFVKLKITYSSDKPEKFDVSDFKFDGVDYTQWCIEQNSERDGYEMDAFIEVGNVDSIFKFSSQFHSKTSGATYKIALLVKSPKGDTIGTYKKEMAIKPINTFIHLSDSIKISRNVKEKSSPAVIAGNN